MSRVFLAVAVVMAALTLHSAYGQPAPADPPADPPLVAPDRPWAAGVSETEQQVALELYNQGNAELAELRYAQALDKYREAITHWDHPAIRFNMVVCLINLDLPLEANESLEKAMAFGGPAIGTAAYAQGLTYRKLLEGRLAKVHLACKEPGAQVSLDGRFLFNGPSSVDLVLLPGEHQILASKEGFVTATENLTLVAGRLATYDVRLVAFKAVTHYERRWDQWKPYAIIGGGLVLAGLGALVHLAAVSNLDDYDAGIAMRCPQGCSMDMLDGIADLRSVRTRAYNEQTLAKGLWWTAGAAALTGVIAVIVNTPSAHVDARPRQPRPLVMPLPNGATVGLAVGF